VRHGLSSWTAVTGIVSGSFRRTAQLEANEDAMDELEEFKQRQERAAQKGVRPADDNGRAHDLRRLDGHLGHHLRGECRHPSASIWRVARLQKAPSLLRRGVQVEAGVPALGPVAEADQRSLLYSYSSVAWVYGFTILALGVLVAGLQEDAGGAVRGVFPRWHQHKPHCDAALVGHAILDIPQRVADALLDQSVRHRLQQRIVWKQAGNWRIVEQIERQMVPRVLHEGPPCVRQPEQEAVETSRTRLVVREQVVEDGLLELVAETVANSFIRQSGQQHTDESLRLLVRLRREVELLGDGVDVPVELRDGFVGDQVAVAARHDGLRADVQVREDHRHRVLLDCGGLWHVVQLLHESFARTLVWHCRKSNIDPTDSRPVASEEASSAKSTHRHADTQNTRDAQQQQQQQQPLAHAKPSGQSQPVGTFLPLPTSDSPARPRHLAVATGRLICEGEDTGVLVDLPGDTAVLRAGGAFGILLDADCGSDEVQQQQQQLARRKRQAVRTDGDGSFAGLQLLLSPAEAFFLMFACGVLRIAGLTCAQLWLRLRSELPRFASCTLAYAAYQHYRSRGWVPKDGASVGADFLLYAQGPAFYHASYAVLLLPEEPDGPASSWRGRLAVARVAERCGLWRLKSASIERTMDEHGPPTDLASMLGRYSFDFDESDEGTFSTIPRKAPGFHFWRLLEAFNAGHTVLARGRARPFVFPDVTVCPPSAFFRRDVGKPDVFPDSNRTFGYDVLINSAPALWRYVLYGNMSHLGLSQAQREYASRLALQSIFRHYINSSAVLSPLDMIAYCSYQGQLCSMDQFSVFFHPAHGSCATFHPPTRIVQPVPLDHETPGLVMQLHTLSPRDWLLTADP
uniref:tRNA-intron lyase n=1 Tax=Macrostomum lignano TaxID=282301 RepID=A0A1I8ITH9_9PLAT